MMNIKILNSASRIFACLSVAIMAASGYSISTKVPAMSLEQMTKEADEIIVGNVVANETKIVGGHFESNYSVQVHENLKSRSAALAPGQSFTFTVAGGALQEPPLTQYVMGAPYLFKGEEVCLFLKKGSGKEPNFPKGVRSANAEKSNLGETYKVVGYNQGRFSVVTRQQDGKKFILRLNLENYGVTNSADQMRDALKAVAQQQIPTVNKPIVRPKDLAANARSKDPLEFTAADGRQLKVERYAQSASMIKEMRQNRALPVQDFEEFKNQVQTIVTSGN